MEPNLLLESQLRALRLPTFVQNYGRFAEDAARNNQSYDRFLLALAEQEVGQRDLNRQRQSLKAAHFPLLKELADFDFSLLPQLNKQRILDLARGEYIKQTMPIILVGNPGLGKSHIATGLATAACRQGYRVRFYNTAALVNELLLAQEHHRLPKFLAAALKHHLIVLDELGFIPFSATGAQLMFQFCSTLHERVALFVQPQVGLQIAQGGRMAHRLVAHPPGAVRPDLQSFRHLPQPGQHRHGSRPAQGL